jgi:hypothetical protein
MMFDCKRDTVTEDDLHLLSSVDVSVAGCRSKTKKAKRIKNSYPREVIAALQAYENPKSPA